jgi:hypothetical protein
VSKLDTLVSVVGIAIIAGGLYAGFGHADKEGAQKILDEEGYTDIVITGRQFFGCEQAFYRTGFTGKNSRGIKVKGVVCGGLVTSSYIRRT